MVSRDKIKKLSKSERKKVYQDKGMKGAEAEGLGAGSCIDFWFPAQWTTEVASYDDHVAVKNISLGSVRVLFCSLTDQDSKWLYNTRAHLFIVNMIP